MTKKDLLKYFFIAIVTVVLIIGVSKFTANRQISGTSLIENTMENKDLIINDVKVGMGATAQCGSEISVHYVGTLTNGTKFDSSRDRGEPFSFELCSGYVIKGWDQGVVGMKIGGVRTLEISPELGYGNRATGSIPPNSTLKFEIELLAVK